MTDAYKHFQELADHHPEGIDFHIRVTDRSSPVAIIAPHGGKIETGTSEIAAAIAGTQYSLYCFEGLMKSKNFELLHLTSKNLNEPRARRLVERSDIVIAVHGRGDGADPRTIWLGGRDTVLRDAIGESLTLAKFAVTTDHDLPGIEPANICNRGRTGAGVQLEIPGSLRDELLKIRSRLQDFAAVVQGAIELRKANTGGG